jgi:hypothetical protein
MSQVQLHAPKDDVSVSFEHWSYTFSPDLLRKYGSRYFSANEAGINYRDDIYTRSSLVSTHNLVFTASQLVAGNEAFPEAAVADPISDLRVWDEWRTGSRYFPYPGRYRTLGITRQDAKIPSPSSVGVLGEIMAGFIAQVGISPFVLVRVVRRWPDFIFSHQNRLYSFVESKAFTERPSGEGGLRGRVLDPLIAEGALAAAQQLTSDPFGKVWYSVTRVVEINPLHLVVTLLELNVEDAIRNSSPPPAMPQVVVDGLAERAVNQAAARVEPRDLEMSLMGLKSNVLGILPDLRKFADEEVPALLVETGEGATSTADWEAISIAIGQLLEKIGEQKQKTNQLERLQGRRFIEAKAEAAEHRLSWIRRSGTGIIYLADLSREEIRKIGQQWTSDWSRANIPWGVLDDSRLWRCGGAVLCAGDDQLMGRDIREATPPGGGP